MTNTWFPASDVVAAALAHGGRHTAVHYVDTAVLDSEIDHLVRGWLARHGIPARSLTVVPVPTATDPQTTVLKPYHPDENVAVTTVLGGGAAMDRVKLATMRGLRLEDLARTRSNLSVLTPEVVRSAPLVAVPTTLGTGAEASAVAIADMGSRRRLIMGRALRPAAYGHDPIAYRTLPGKLLREGLVEILSRLAGPYVGDPRGESLADTICRNAIRRLVRRGDDIVAALDAETAPAPTALAEVAAIGALSHAELVQRPHCPWGVKLWAIANELSAASGMPKIPATVALWPSFWEQVDVGIESLGHRVRLREIWADIRDAHRGSLPPAPGPGIAALLEQWSVTGIDATAISIDQLVNRVQLAWGAGLPILSGVRDEDLRALFSQARNGTVVRSSDGLATNHWLPAQSTITSNPGAPIRAGDHAAAVTPA